MSDGDDADVATSTDQLAHLDLVLNARQNTHYHQ